MTGLGALTKKELKEQLKTYRLLVVAAVFTLLGLATPLMIKYLPELIKLSGEDIQVTFPTPTAAQALREYADSLSQVGILAAILIGMGAVARERERGTAAMTLCKPVGRGAFIVAKLLAMSATFTIALLAASLACFGYTLLLFGQADAAPFAALNLLLWLFFIMCLSVTLLCSSLFRSQLAAGGASLAILIGQSLLSGMPRIGQYAPGTAVGWGMRLVSGGEATGWPAVAVTIAVIVLCLYLSWLVLRRREL